MDNITSISKLIEWITLNRFSVHCGLFKLLPARQSEYIRFHSTETAVAIVHNNIVRATDAGQITALVLLVLSAAFDTVDHDWTCCPSGLVLWIESLNGSSPARQAELKSSAPALTTLSTPRLRRLVAVYLRDQLPGRCCSSIIWKI